MQYKNKDEKFDLRKESYKLLKKYHLYTVNSEKEILEKLEKMLEVKKVIIIQV
jgi:hypothetical protein